MWAQAPIRFFFFLEDRPEHSEPFSAETHYCFLLFNKYEGSPGALQLPQSEITAN